MNYEYEIGTYTEDDRIKELPEEYKLMTSEEKEAEMARLYAEMKANPQIKEKIKSSIKFYI
ncbi:hypothetical protein [Butyrivibrio fibrisolvens]|uniref:hypothetical protein n=1 Tax=Butyrivibrio fibrisolvens TaxID=831 RepID=UPI0003B407D3|nr:hypothetical protein [Butyrivibrio fibrisolvens]